MPQAKLSAREMTLKLRVIFSWINDELEDVSADSKIDFKQVVRMQFFYKYLLRVINHWNFCHSTVGGGISLPMQRNLAQTLSDQNNKALLGIILNELDFLRMFLGFDNSASAGGAGAIPATTAGQRVLSGSLPNVRVAMSRGSATSQPTTASVPSSLSTSVPSSLSTSVPSSLSTSPVSRGFSGPSLLASSMSSGVA